MSAHWVTVLGVGAVVPDRVITNDDLAAFLDTSDGWIVRRTGIRERRIAGPEMATSDLAVQAARQVLESAGAGAADLDLILVAISTSDQWMPSTAVLVQHALGASRAGALVVNAACAFGDGAGAVVLGASRGPALFHCILGADGPGARLLEIPAGGSRMPPSTETVRDRLHAIRMQGRKVFRFGVEILVRSLREATEEAGLRGSLWQHLGCIDPTRTGGSRLRGACAPRRPTGLRRVRCGAHVGCEPRHVGRWVRQQEVLTSCTRWRSASPWVAEPRADWHTSASCENCRQQGSP